MSTIKPFPGVRYTTDKNSDLSNRLAPPYDILGEDDKRALLSRDPHNFVEIDLPHTPPKAAGPPEKYEQARKTLDAWLADGVMTRDDQPALYVYHQVYHYGGAAYVRKMFFARLKLEPFGEGSIFPHERTFGGPKEDRLALTKATQTNLSPIFGLYEDADNVVARRLERALPGEPLATGKLDDVENRLWAVTDRATIDEVAKLMGPKATFIADGHHRCGTAMLYRDWLNEQEGPLPEDHPANYVLCVFCAMEDPGLLILPTHRVLPDVGVTRDTFENDDQVKVTPLEVQTADQAIFALKDLGPQAVGVYAAQDKKFWAIHPQDATILDKLEPDRTEAWRRLGLAFLHAYVLERTVKPKLLGGEDPEIRYIKANDAAVEEADSTGGTAFLMQATTMEEMRAVCSAGDLMPQKSTYFYPKLASGLVVNPLT